MKGTEDAEENYLSATIPDHIAGNKTSFRRGNGYSEQTIQ